MPLGPIGHLLHKATPLRPGDIHRNKHSKAAKMGRQRNMSQMKEQNKTPEKELNKMETSNLLVAELKTMVIRMLSDFSENFN